MARGRMISKALSTSEKRAALHQVVPHLAEFCQAMYPLMVAHSDDFGRLQGDPFTVKHAIEPTSPRPLGDFALGIQALHDVGLIQWYGGGGRKFIQINDFERHQQGLAKRTRSAFPEPPADSGNFQEIPSEEKGTEEKGTEGKKNGSPEPDGSGQTTTSPTVMQFPIVGAGGSVWALTEFHLASYEEQFPNLDVRLAARRARGWLDDNPGRRKTAKGMPQFLRGWFGRSVDRGECLKAGLTRAATSTKPGIEANGLTPRTNAVRAGLGRS